MTLLHALSDPALQQRARQAVRALPDAPAALQQVAISLWAASPLAQGLPGQLANPAVGLPGRMAELAQAGLAQAGLALVRHLAAVLQFDSWAAAAVAPGMRSLRSPTRHLLFSSAGRDIDLRIAPASQGYALSGQVLGPDEAGSVELFAEPAEPGDAAAQHAGELDALGEFRIDGVAAGAWRLRLRIGSDLIALPTIEVGDAASAAAQPAPPDGPIA